MKFTKVNQQEADDQVYQREQFSMDVLMGLCSTPKSISAKYFYDDKGSELFQKITKHVDYYPTNTEFEILKNIKTLLPEKMNESEIDIIELGVGDGHKSRLLIDGFLNAQKKVNYYPIDISEKAMHLLQDNITRHDNLNVNGIVGEYFEGLRFARKKSKNKQLVLFLGSNIGNFNPVQSLVFLRKLWKSLNNGDQILIGFDLKKDIKILHGAYNDSAGITAEFNLNLLTRLNSELGANFDLSQFQHFGSYNPTLGAMESFLISLKAQEVFVEELQRSFSFKAYEPLHLEYSFKFLKSDIVRLSQQAGFQVDEHFADPKNYFVDSLWTVEKG